MCFGKVMVTKQHRKVSAPDLGEAQGAWVQGPPPKRSPHHVHGFSHMCDMGVPLSHFYREKFVCRRYLLHRSAKQQYFTWRRFDIVTKQPLHLLVSWKSARYLNLVNAKPSYVEHASFRLSSFLADFASALLRFAQVAFE